MFLYSTKKLYLELTIDRRIRFNKSIKFILSERIIMTGYKENESI